MKNAAFDEFVKSQQVPEHPEIDWNQMRDEWLQHLDELYDRIHGFLKEYIDSGQMQLEFNSIELNEDNIGRYTARQVTLKIGRKQVRFQPVGTLLLGSRGRVDVIGAGITEARLVLVNKKFVSASDVIRISINFEGKLPSPPENEPNNIELAWKIVTRPPDRRFIELTQETLFKMIMEVA
ncbi:MAG: hypothetical protein ACLPSO_05475, partial [Terracidiphilus sp.]